MPKKGKFGAEEKVSIIQEYLEGRVSFSESVKRVGCNEWTFQQWVKRYKAEWIEAFMPHERNRRYSPELKLRAVQDYLNGNGSLMDISGKYKIRDTQTLRARIKVYNAHGDFNSVKQSGGGSYMKQGRETSAGRSEKILQGSESQRMSVQSKTNSGTAPRRR